MSAWCIIFDTCSVIAVPRWLAIYILLGLPQKRYVEVMRKRYLLFLILFLSVCHDSLYTGRKDSFSAFQPTDKVSFQCCVGVCSVRAYSAEREAESGGFQLCSTAMAGWERPLLCVRRVTDSWGRFLTSWVKVIQHAYPLNQSFTFHLQQGH